MCTRVRIQLLACTFKLLVGGALICRALYCLSSLHSTTIYDTDMISSEAMVALMLYSNLPMLGIAEGTAEGDWLFCQMYGDGGLSDASTVCDASWTPFCVGMI